MFLVLGDCNVTGADKFNDKTYVEILQKQLNIPAISCGHTMTTTKEGKIYFDKNKNVDFEFVVVAYGLVDSWETFKYAPYVLYYPDNIFRKIARKVIKKYKKIARNFHLNEKIGKKHVVPIKEYKKNIEYIIQNSKKVFLVETPPHQSEIFRNKHIVQYNQVLKDLSKKYNHAKVIHIYESLLADQSLYFDVVHLNEKGYSLIAQKIILSQKELL